MKKKLLLLVLFGPFLIFSQVKIGANPETIDSGSILELESNSKALVLPRLSNEQMSGLNPLNGALIFNTDTSCLHYYGANQWTNLCTVLSGIRFTDNGDGTVTLEDGQGDEITFNGADDTVTTLIDNMNGTYTYTNEAGNPTVLNVADNQNLSTDGNPGNIEISNGNALVINVNDSDSDDQNEIQDIEFNGGIITLTNDPGNTSIDLSNYDDDVMDDFDGEWGSLSNIPPDIADGDDDTITTLTQDNGTGVITYTNESLVDQTANILSSDSGNEITVGSDGGAFYQSNVKAFGKIAADGSIIRATAGVTVTRVDLDMNNVDDIGRYRVNLPNNLVNDNDYIIQLSQPSREGVGNDAPSITYLDQNTTHFDVFIGDNDNGGSDAAGFDSEFMFVIFDL